MYKFNRRMAPFVVILNFLLSYKLTVNLLYLLKEPLWFNWVELIIELLLISIINLIIIVIMKKKYGDEFSVPGHITFLVAIPSVLPIIMHYTLVLITEIMYMLGIESSGY